MLRNLTTGETLAQHVRLCDTFVARGRGLMFRRHLPADTALVFAEGRESIVGASIHMLFVFFPIAVIWLDRRHQVVDCRLAHPFRPYYAPCQPAQYFIEGDPSLLARVQPGHVLEWETRG
jgi:uncharacterized membrane protein (UPF0127 family)